MAPARKEPDKDTYSGRFAIRLRQLREKAGLTVEELAERMEIVPRTVFRWESQETEPKLDQMFALAKVLKVSIRNLFPEK